MAKTLSEVSIMRYFETEPIDKASVLHSLIAAKMRERLGRNRSEDSRPKERDAARRRRAASDPETPSPDGAKGEPQA